MTSDEAITYLKEKGVDTDSIKETLDLEVEEVKAREAKAINEKGTREQLGFLLYGCPDETALLDALVLAIRADARQFDDDDHTSSVGLSGSLL